MVPDIARTAVIRKTKKDVNIMTGNYEAAYAIGLLSMLSGVSVDSAEKSIANMKDRLLAGLEAYTSKSEEEKILIQMLKHYKPSAVWDEDVETLYQMGRKENANVLTAQSPFHI